MKVSLKILRQGTIREHVLSSNGAVTFGRSRLCEIQLEDTKVSGKHCRLNLKKDRLEVTDLDSKNGTYLNGIRVEQTEIFAGDEVRIGDTLITMQESKMQDEDVKALSFPGPEHDRLEYALKADFTGARIQNQIVNKKNQSLKLAQIASHAKEIDLRKRINSPILISKQEIRNRNKLPSFIATLLDVVTLLMVISSPLFIVASLPSQIGNQTRILVLIGLAALFGGAFIFYNYKKSKFTVGEKLAGIQRLHSEQ